MPLTQSCESIAHKNGHDTAFALVHKHHNDNDDDDYHYDDDDDDDSTWRHDHVKELANCSYEYLRY